MLTARLIRFVKWYTTYADLCFLDLIILVSISTLMEMSRIMILENIESRNIDKRLISNQIAK